GRPNPRQRLLTRFRSTNNLVDIFRKLHPTKKAFTHWFYKSTKTTEMVTSTRLDFFLISTSLVRKTTEATIIDEDTLLSDHRVTTITLQQRKPPKPTPPTIHLRKLKPLNRWPSQMLVNLS